MWPPFLATFELDRDNMVTGLWCDDCQLPSVVSIPMLMLYDMGVCRAGSIATCVNCDESEDEGDEGGYLVGG